ncbi:VENN motif pre-toxin domain-containing protein [Erwinia psidii]|uniref:VENN motif pre-toxin domain-containing protein n=1 Tax=Erwinia psidii TaxID=69224 RepID=UPI00226B5E7A|nr:VENN motif pre-toxin domain-containing protein [Erwinia psidii]
MAHAAVNAALAAAQGNSALVGAAGAATAEMAGMIALEVYGKSAGELSETEKQTVSALATLAAGLAGGLTGDSTADTVAAAQAGKTTVENNYLSVQEAERKAVLERKDKAGAITPDEKNELATINQTDKARDQAIKAVCTDGNKGGSGCGALIGPAQEALDKYGENVTYSLLYKDLYPQDAKNLESVLQGLDAGSISRDQAITAIAQASGVSWETAADRYDTAMQAQALTAALAGAAGLKGVTEKPAGSTTTKPSQPATPNKGSSQAETKPSSGAENAATYPKLKDDLVQQNLNNIAKQDPRLDAVVKGDNGKLNYGVGSGTKTEADRLGKIWVGDGAIPTTDGKGLVSADGLRVYRYPDAKPNAPINLNPTGTQANFETYKINPATGERVRVGNGHMSINK